MSAIRQIGNDKRKLECECDYCHKIFISKSSDNYRTSKYTFCAECVKNSDNEEYALVRLNHPISTRRVIPGVNDLFTHSQAFIDCFENKELAKTYSRGTHHKFVFKCPVCGNTDLIVGREMYKHKCRYCIHDALSYPNKLIRSLMKQLPVDYVEYEYSPEWIKPYRYDCYFEINTKKYIVEMDGGLGHGFHKFNSTEKDIEGLEKDRYKDEQAQQHGITVIRVDSRLSKIQYIRKSIEDSLLATIFDLTKIDWESCNKQAFKNWTIEVCNYYKSAKGNDKNTSHIAKVFDLDITTVQKYLNLGTKAGLCFYDKEVAQELRKENARKRLKEISYRVVIKLKNGDYVGTFTMADAVKYLKNNKDIKSSDYILEEGIRRVCRKDKYRNSYYGFVFEYA